MFSFLSLLLYKYISEFNKFMVQLTWGGSMDDPTTTSINTEGMSKILINIIETSYCKC
jgi:hypothetical protein